MRGSSTVESNNVRDDSTGLMVERIDVGIVAVRSRLARPWLIVAEAGVSVAAALLMVVLARGIEVDPLDRIGQVSGLAGLQLRFALLALVLLAAVLIAGTARWRRLSPLAVRLVAAAVAGLASGMVAGAVAVALRGTTWGLLADQGDAGTLIGWARTVRDGGSMPASYPPGFIHVLAWYARLTGDSPEHSLKVLQIVGTALFGPAAYLAWRLLLSPVWALGLGIVPALPLIEAYKPYANVALVVTIPILLALLGSLRRSGTKSWRHLVLAGCGYGAGLGVAFLVYSGWVVWSAPGVLAAALLVFPWRHGWRRGLVLVCVTVAAFLAVAFRHLFALLSGSAPDRYYFFDTWAEPTYIAMWRGDLPGANPGPWPPPGELGGVGLFTILLFVGLAAAIAVARRRTIVLSLACILAGAWLLRFYFSSRMYATDTVQLYPRSAVELLYCLLLLSGFAIYYTVRHLTVSSRAGWLRSAMASGSVRIGALVGVLLLIASATSAIGDRYMPRTDNSLGMLAFTAHVTRQPGGGCAAHVASADDCPARDDPRYARLVQRLWDGGGRTGDLPHRAGR